MSDETHIIVALIGFIGIFVSAVFSYLCHKHAREINDSVNHKHEKAGPGALKLYDLVWHNFQTAQELIEWKRGYDDGPLSTGSKVFEFVQETGERLEKIENHIQEASDGLGSEG